MSKAPAPRFKPAADVFATTVWCGVVIFGCIEFVALFWLDVF